MAKDLLLEVGMEEVPARFVRPAVQQLEERMVQWLQRSHIDFGQTQIFATPRRIAVLVRDVAERQSDLQEEVKGPAKKIALDENGQWSKAALGFAKSQGVEPDSLIFKEFNGTEYVYAVKRSEGTSTESLLPEGLKHVIEGMSFPKNMRWGSHDLRFVRPIRWLVAMYGKDTILLEIAGVQSGNVSRGHRFLGGDVEIESPLDYREALRKEYVVADIEERRQMIVEQLKNLEREKGWKLHIPEDLLEEVLFLVEYPTALFGSFDPDFLNIPQEVLMTSMREHQRYFPVLNEDGKLLPYFVTVRNGDAKSLDNVVKGNEKVLRARLSDARFFYEEDLKLSIPEALERLETIVFHEELGTLAQKVRRMEKIASDMANALGMDEDSKKQAARAVQICKFDLVTQMVYEFPELQGVMGEEYARRAGEDPRVARAIFEHYQPRFSGDEVPRSLIGAVVSMADKIDTIAGCFSIGIVPTGSQDPYALRRQAAGIVQILWEHDLPLKLSDLFDSVLKVLKEQKWLKRSEDQIRQDLIEFFALRMRNILSEFARHDVVDAVMGGGFDRVPSAVRRGQALMKAILRPEEMKGVVESFNRVSNLAVKAPGSTFDPGILTEKEEKDLYQTWEAAHQDYLNLLDSGREDEALSLLGQLKEPITRFFDKVMVMVDDENLRLARLGLLKAISDDLKKFADFQKIVW